MIGMFWVYNTLKRRIVELHEIEFLDILGSLYSMVFLESMSSMFIYTSWALTFNLFPASIKKDPCFVQSASKSLHIFHHEIFLSEYLQEKPFSPTLLNSFELIK